jgi:hypothetical protein
VRCTEQRPLYAGNRPLKPYQALTIGAIARELNEPVHRVQYAVKTRGLVPEAVAGHIRVFPPESIERVAEILREIDQQAAAGRDGAE